MDFLLPDDETMEKMRGEFQKLRKDSNTLAFALANNSDTSKITHSDRSLFEGFFSDTGWTYISRMLLLLYFVKHLGYNMSYGTEIFDTDRGLEQLRRVGSNFRQLNDLGGNRG